MADSIRWECLHCGDCCRNVGDKQFGFSAGLFLLPQEVDLFPPDLVKPYIRSDKGSIVAYQFIGDTCVHLDQGVCAVYDRRPIICRAFPLETDGIVGIVNPRCRALVGVSEIRLNDLCFPETIWQANLFLSRYINSSQASAMFDFRRNIWLNSKQMIRFLAKELASLKKGMPDTSIPFSSLMRGKTGGR